MKYLRMLLALLFGSAFLGLVFIVSSVTGIQIVNSSNIGSSPILYLIIISLVPFITITTSSWKNPLPQIDGIKENALLLNCMYEKTMSINILNAKKKIKDIANSLMFRDNELFEKYEDDDSIEFYVDIKERNELEKEKNTSIPFKNTYIIVSFKEIDKDNTRINIKVESDNPISIFANNYNREILNYFIDEINKEV